MKEFKSTDLRRNSAEVFSSVVEDGVAIISHSGYKDKLFRLSVINESRVSKITREMFAKWEREYQPPLSQIGAPGQVLKPNDQGRWEWVYPESDNQQAIE